MRKGVLFLHYFEPPRREERKGVFLLPFLDRNPGEIITKEGFTGQADDHEKHNALRAGCLLRLF